MTVSFRDYIANVASSEISPTWPEESLRANIHAQISIALNRIYTEWYKSKGYSFDITNSTSYDQYYVHGRTVFDVMIRITDDIFNTYIRKTGTINPYYAEYCDGKQVSCKGMKQWGTCLLYTSGAGRCGPHSTDFQSRSGTRRSHPYGHRCRNRRGMPFSHAHGAKPAHRFSAPRPSSPAQTQQKPCTALPLSLIHI